MRENHQKPIDETLLQFIPRRQMVRTNDFVSAATTNDMNFAQGVDYTDLINAVREEQKYFEKSANDNSRFCYISHQKKDGILSAKVLAGKLRVKDSKKPGPVCNPSVDEKNFSNHIKWSRLREKALAEGLVTKEKLPLTSIMLSVVSSIVLILDLLSKTLELTDHTGDNVFISFLKHFNAGIVLTCVLIALIATSVALIVIHTRKHRKTLITKINQVLREMDTKEFVEFLSGFEGDDFMIPDCDTEATVFLCVLQNYSIKERYVLRAYWSNVSQRQLWWIFAEATRENEAFVVPYDQKYSRRFYFQKPLTKADKRKIADKTYCDKASISPTDDSGICIFGVDWLYRFHLKEREPIGDTEQLNEKLDRFCGMYAAGYQTDIKLVIRLVADLACTYNIDLYVRRNWEYLFSDNDNLGDPLLNALDKQIAGALNLDNRTFRNLIPEIMDVFSKDLEEIVAKRPNNAQTSEYEQWCIIKTLKTRKANPEESYLAVCDTLMAEFAACAATPEDIGRSALWRDILLKSAEIFYKKQFFWFLPTLLHNLLTYFGNESNERLFSQSIILEIARANFLLSIQVGTESYLTSKFDPVQDHYRIVCAAIAERGDEKRLGENTSVPASFEMLQFTSIERRRYYNALRILGEQKIIDFLNYLFDMFCAVVSTNVESAKFCYSVLYDKSLFAEYLANTGLTTNRKNYITVISRRLLNLLDDCFGEKISSVKNSINYLRSALSEEQPVDDLLLLVAELDVLGFSTLNFVACMLGLADDSEEISRDIYLNLGNYLLGVVFLAYYELVQDSFYNEDFKYLIKLCTSYQEPGSTALGFLQFCDTRLTPTNTRIRVQEYIREHKAVYIEDLCSLAARLKQKDLDNFLVFLTCIGSLNPKEKVSVYEVLRKHIEEGFADSSESKFYLELICLTLNDCSICEFADKTPDAIVDAIMTQSDDMMYMLFHQYCRLWPEKYRAFCHTVAPKAVQAHFVGTTSLLIDCLLLTQDDAATEEIAKTNRVIYDVLEDDLSNQRISDMKFFEYFLTSVWKRLKTVPELYSWTTEDEIMRKLTQIDLRQRQLIKLQTEAFCAERKWSNYGIAIYLQELMSTDRHGKHTPDGFPINGTAAEKKAYFIAHFQNMAPMVTIGDCLRQNVAYAHMLAAFIRNTGDIQHALDEKECMRKLTQDLMTVVKTHEMLTEDQKSRVRHLIVEYRRQSV